MKKLLLILILAIAFAFTTFAQGYIGQTSYYIKNDVNERYGTTVKAITPETGLLTIEFYDGRTGIYILNDNNVCKYYCLCYPNSFYTDMVGYMNNHYTKISGLYTWYEKIDANYVYYEFITREKVFWMVIYPDFYNSEALELKKML